MDDAELQSRLDNSASLLVDIEKAQRVQQAALNSARTRLDAAKHAYEEVQEHTHTRARTRWSLLFSMCTKC